MTSYSTTKLDLYNKHGERLCDAFGCRKHKRLRPYRGGYFCARHAIEIDAIRSSIDHTQTQQELTARLEELRFRKVIHAPHANYVVKLEGMLQ